MKRPAALLLAFLLAAAPSFAQEFRSGPEKVSLLELYTSEGCSSCPPAEAWLSRKASSPDLWKKFVPAAFHVDYWDRLGWKDPFSSALATRRERAYASLWSANQVYTPCFVLNGEEFGDWSSAEPDWAGPRSGLLAASSRGGKWEVAYEPSLELLRGGQWTVHAALLGMGRSVKIEAGENAGRTLTHDFVVLAHESSAAKLEEGRLTAALSPRAGGADAIALWIEKNGVPVQAAGGILEKE